jgi:hypothetical protein
MIRANELRYGNKVKNQQGQVITVQQILCNTLIYDTQITVSREAANPMGSYKTVYTTQFKEVIKEADFQEVDPIALTPKILEKCGFRNFVREEWIFTTGSMHIDFEFTDEGLRLRNPAAPRVSIRYFHELQNYLFAIAGHELEGKF